MCWAVGNGIITGTDHGTRLNPQGYANRAECATIIMRFCEMYGISQVIVWKYIMKSNKRVNEPEMTGTFILLCCLKKTAFNMMKILEIL